MTPRSLFLVSLIALVTIFSILNCFFDRSNDLRAAEALLSTYSFVQNGLSRVNEQKILFFFFLHG